MAYLTEKLTNMNLARDSSDSDIDMANEIRIENSKTGKMTAVVAILKIFGEYINNSRNANPKKS